MPGMNGLETLEKIRKIKSAVGVIMLSAFGDNDTVRDAMNMGANFYLQKPIEFKKLIEILDDWKAEASPGDNIEFSENDLANLKVIKNAPTLGGPVEVTQEELEAFRVEATQAELEAFKVVQSSSSPGDPATFSAEELESVKSADKTPSSQETDGAEVK